MFGLVGSYSYLARPQAPAGELSFGELTANVKATDTPQIRT